MAGDRPTIDYVDFFRAVNPSKTLDISKESDRRYYIDFTAVRGDKVIRKLKNRIVRLSPDEPTCSLFTGHIGCGKSTELLRLKKELEEEKFFVVYFMGDDYLDTADVDIIDVLLAIAGQIARELEQKIPPVAEGLRKFLLGVRDVLLTEIEVKAEAKFADQKLGADTETGEVKLSTVFGDLTMKAKNDPGWRSRLNQFVGPQLNKLIDGINDDLIRPGIEQLKGLGYKGLVVIVDNLDRIDNRTKASGRSQQEYLFVDKGEALASLACHKVYTMPLALRFSNEFSALKQRFTYLPECLPMVQVITQQGEAVQEGIDKLKQMVLARAFPTLPEEERFERVSEIFESDAAFDRLCRVSGGHVRDLLKLLVQWVEEEMDLPLTEVCLEDAITEWSNEMQLMVSSDEWELLRQVRESKQVSGDEEGYQPLIRSRMVFEYCNRRQSWFDVNPILLEVGKLP
ncbi:MAG: ATP-binding protein [Cyanobacteria bacterium P01_C01_bin.89]